MEEQRTDIELGRSTTVKPSISMLEAVQNDDKTSIQNWLEYLKGNPAEEAVLTDEDDSGNTIAHILVLRCDTEVLTTLLSGFSLNIDKQNSDGFTPMHLACIKGYTKIVKLILEYASCEKVLSTKDHDSNSPLQLAMFYGHEEAALVILKRCEELTNNFLDEQQNTLLHLAAKYNLCNAMDYLFESNADLESKNLQLQTPLMVAVSCGRVDTALKLIENKASIEGVDDQGRNIVHLAAEQDLVPVLEALDHDIFLSARRAIDFSGNTPLHIAAMKGSLAVCKFLLNAQTPMDQRSTDEKTPLHIAAECGNTLIVQRLLCHQKQLLNQQDANRCTPLHLACQQGHTAVAEVLVNAGARIDFKNDKQETPLISAICANSKEIVQVLIKGGAGMVDHGKDILSLASIDIAFTLLAAGLISADIGLGEFIKKQPALAEEVLNRCIESSTDLLNIRMDKTDCLLTLNFEPIEDDVDREEHVFSLMVQHKCVRLLKHPVVKSLIQYKWTKYGRFFYLFNLFSYLIFLVFLTSFAIVVLNPSHPTCLQAFSNSRNSSEKIDCKGLSPTRFNYIIGAAYVIVLIVSIRLVFEFFQFLQLKLQYFKETVNLFEIVLYFSTLNFVWIFHAPCLCVAQTQWEFGVIAVFLAWIILTIFADKFPLAGLYVLMFISIFKTFLKTVILSLLLLVSFGLAFFMLFHDPSVTRSPFGSPFIAIVKTMAMSEGEFDFDENFAVDRSGNTTGISFPVTSFFIWFLFLVVMSILLTNLLTGLAVDDVRIIQDNATLKRLELKITFLLAIDGFRRQFDNYIPRIICDWLTTSDKITVLVYHELSVWQKLQLFLLAKKNAPYDLKMSAEEFETIAEDQLTYKQETQSQKAESDMSGPFADLQVDIESIHQRQDYIKNQMIECVKSFEKVVLELTNSNQEMKRSILDLSRQNVELKEALEELQNIQPLQKQNQ